MPPIGFSTDTQPITVHDEPKTHRFIKPRWIALIVILGLLGGAGYLFTSLLGSDGSQPTTAASAPAMWVNAGPTGAVAPTSEPYGVAITYQPYDGMDGFTITAKTNGDVLFSNMANVPVNIGDFGFGYVLADGSTGGALGTDHWGVTLQPGEKFTSHLRLPANSTIVMVIRGSYGHEVEVGRWS